MIFQIAKKHQKLSSAVLLAVFVLVVFGGVLAPVFQDKVSAYEYESDDPYSQASADSIAAASKSSGDKCGWIDIKCGARAFVGLMLNGYFYIVGMILSFEFAILQWVLQFFSWKNDTVTLGWGIVRDFSNLFFIVVIMIIAFATVLQLETYGMKALLPKLIAIALLINFSLAICGFLINFADAFGQTFIDAGGGGPALTLAVKEGLGAGNLTSDGTASKASQDIAEKVKEDATKGDESTFLSIILTFALGILSGLIMIFVIGAGVFFMMIRQISLMFIVILSPIALICLLVPFLNDKWSEWKSAFLKWVMFYPLYMFFFYIAIKIINSKAISTPGLDGVAKGYTGVTSPQAMWRMFIASMFLIGAIMVAQKTGVAGASAIGNFGMKQLKDFTGMTRAGKAFEAAGKRREERREERRTLGIGAQLRERFGTRGMKERAILDKKEAEKKVTERLDKVHNIKRDEQGNIKNWDKVDWDAVRAETTRRAFTSAGKTRKREMVKTLAKPWALRNIPQKTREKKEEEGKKEFKGSQEGGGGI